MVLSAGVWVLFFAVPRCGHVGADRMITTRDVNADTPRKLAALRTESDARWPESRIDINGPDIAPLGLCRGGDSWVV